MKKITSAAIACVLALTVSYANAAPMASASIMGYGYELIDLNPNDGIDPSILLTPRSVWVSTTAYQHNLSAPYLRQRTQEAGTVEVVDATGHASAQWGDDGAIASATASHNRFYANVSLWHNFVLSPFTTVIFRAFATGTQNAPGGYSFGGAQLIAYNDWDDSLPYVSDDTGYGYNPVSRELILSLTSGAIELAGHTGYSVYAQSGGEPIQVPEPSSIATLLAGLFIIQVCRRKRHSMYEFRL